MKTISKSAVCEWLHVSRASMTAEVEPQTGLVTVKVPPSRAAMYDANVVLRCLLGARQSSVLHRGEFLRHDTRWLTSDDVGAILGVSKFAVLRWAKTKLVVHYRFGKACIRFAEDDVRTFAKRTEAKGVRFWNHDGGGRMRFTRWMRKAK